MRSTRVLLLGLVVVMSVLFVAGEVVAQIVSPVCFAWQRIACTFDFSLVQGTIGESASDFRDEESCDDLVPQVYWLDIIASATAGGPFFKYIGRHDGACGPNTSRPMEGTAWMRSNGRIELGFLTYGETSTSGSKSSDEFDTNCGDIKAHAFVDSSSLTGTIKWVERVTRSGTHIQADEVFVPAAQGNAGQPFGVVVCPGFVPGN